MKAPRPLPEDMVPYAERLFSWFPEVLVTLGSPNLCDLFDLPPMPSVQMRLEETGDYKIVHIRLNRRTRRRRTKSRESASPFSKSRALVNGQGRGTSGVAPSAAPAPAAAPGRGSSGVAPSTASAPAAAPGRGSSCVAPSAPCAPAAAPGNPMSTRDSGSMTSTRCAPVPEQVECAVDEPVVPRRREARPVGAAAEAPPGPRLDARTFRSDERAPAPAPAPTPGTAEDDSRRLRRSRTIGEVPKKPPAKPEPPRSPSKASSDTEPPETAGAAPTVSAASRKLTLPHFLRHHDPGSPRLSSPGSHNPWGGSAPMPLLEQETCEEGDPPQASPTTPPEMPAAQPSPKCAGASGSAGDLEPGRLRPPRPDTVKESGTPTREASEFRLSEGSSAEAPCGDASPNGVQSPLDTPSPQLSTTSAGASEGVTASRLLSGQSDEDLATVLEECECGEDTVAPPTGSGGRTLGKRRGLKMTIPQVWRRGTSDTPKSPNDHNLTLNLPAVLCRIEGGVPSQMPKSMLHPLPGAFPHRRSLIFFDWDDTLCPTSWIRRILKDHMSDQWDWAMGADSVSGVVDWQDQIPAWFGQPLPDLPDIRDQIRQLQHAVINVINVAQSLGIVCIVTNAVDGWVDKTMQKWLPGLKQYVLGHGAQPPITVLYGQQQYVRPAPESEAGSLEWVDNLGELTWWKKAAMHHALEHVDDLYRVERPIDSPGRPRPRPPATDDSRARAFRKAAAADAAPGAEAASGAPEAPPATAPQGAAAAAPLQPCVPWQADSGAKGLVSVVSIGDSEAEMQAAELAALEHVSRGPPPPAAGAGRKRPLSAPTGRRLPRAGHPWVKNVKLREGPNADQLIEQLRLLARVLPQIVAARSDLRLGPEEMHELLAAPEDHETRLQRLLRTQTV